MRPFYRIESIVSNRHSASRRGQFISLFFMEINVAFKIAG
jgi:hypothetical protein